MVITDFFKYSVDKKNAKGQPDIGRYEAMVPRFDKDESVAKNLFQICLTLEGDGTAEEVMQILTSEFTNNIANLKKKNPDYCYRLISNKEAVCFIEKYYGSAILKYWNRIDNTYLAAKADFLRYLLLYALGGIYVDLKSTIDIPLSKTIRDDDKYLVFYWDNLPNGQHHYLIPEYIKGGEMLQGFIISARGHCFLRSCILNVMRQIDRYNPYENGVGWQGVLTTTGPALYTRTIYDEIQRCSDTTIYRYGQPFNEFGFRLYIAGKYSPGAYQRKLSMTDYRKSSRPVVRCKNPCLQVINVCWLRILQLYRERVKLL